MDIPDEFKPKLASDVQVRFFKEDERGRFYIIGRGEKKSTFLKIHEVGQDILGMLDGSNTVIQIIQTLKRRGIEVDLPRFIKLLGERGFLENSLFKEKIKEKDSLRIYHFPLVNKPEKIIGAIYMVLSRFFRKKFLALFSIFNLVAMLYFVFYIITSGMRAEDLLFFQRSAFLTFLIYLFLILPFLALGHELAHGIACFHYGGRPSEIGVAVYLLVPLFYVDTSDTWMFDKKQSIHVFLAGPLFTLFIGNLCFLISLLFPSYTRAFILMAFGSYIAAIVGLNPFIEADGYYILQTLLGFPNLQSHAWNYSLLQFKHRLGLCSKKDYQEFIDCYSKNERKILAIYAPIVLIVNGVFLALAVPWAILFLNEYIQLTLAMFTLSFQSEAITILIWTVQSFYVSLLFIYYPFRIFKFLIRR